MSSNPSLREFAKDLYRLLQLPRTATQIDIKRSYREMALTLHPDRHVQGENSSSGNDEGNNNFVDTQQQQQTTTTSAAAEQARIRLTKERKTAQFKEVNEAYRILSDIALRREYDRWLDTVDITSDGHVYKRGTSRAAERNPFYRKVYSPAAPPGMKTFDRQRHYGKREKEREC
jgi:curved DNA-binding protein CbpA